LRPFVACAAKNAVDMNCGLIVAFSEGGKTMRLAAKYRPNVPVLVRHRQPPAGAASAAAVFGLFPYLLDEPIKMHDGALHGGERLRSGGGPAAATMPHRMRGHRVECDSCCEP
jgi:pyruvate kinase